MDDITDSVRAKINEKYKSVRQFAIEAGILYTTLKSALANGIGGMAVKTTINIFDRLGIDISVFNKKNKPVTGEDDRREELINQIASMLGDMDISQLNRFKTLTRYAFLPEDEFLRLTNLLEFAKLPPLKT